MAGTSDIGRFNNSSQGRFACGLSAFDVLCDMHLQIHKHDLHSLLKNLNSEDSATSSRIFFFPHLSSTVSFIVTFFSIMCLTAWCFAENFGPGSTLLSTSWVQQFVLLLSATCPLTSWHCRLSGPLCVRLAKNNAHLSCPSPTHLAFLTPAVGCVCGLAGKLRPVFNPWPLLYSAVDIGPSLRCTTWNADVFRSKKEYICFWNADTWGYAAL